MWEDVARCLVWAQWCPAGAVGLSFWALWGWAGWWTGESHGCPQGQSLVAQLFSFQLGSVRQAECALARSCPPSVALGMHVSSHLCTPLLWFFFFFSTPLVLMRGSLPMCAAACPPWSGPGPLFFHPLSTAAGETVRGQLWVPQGWEVSGAQLWGPRSQQPQGCWRGREQAAVARSWGFVQGLCMVSKTRPAPEQLCHP